MLSGAIGSFLSGVLIKNRREWLIVCITLGLLVDVLAEVIITIGGPTIALGAVIYPAFYVGIAYGGFALAQHRSLRRAAQP